jgi:hypothetical protein
LSTFPSLHPDETLYSAFARYSMLNGNTNYKHTIQDLFGVTTKRSVPDFPSNIQTILNRFPQINLKPEEVIYKHTLVPFYTPFIPEDRVKKIIQKMINSDGSRIHTQVGINASNIRTNRTLKHCPQCIKEDIHLLGETYWHRVHQLPGIFVCPKHKIPIIEIEKNLYNFNQHQFLLASEELLDFPKKINVSKQTYDILVSLANEAEWVLNNIITMPDYTFYRDRYIALLQNANIALPNGRVDQKCWFERFSRYYNDEALHLLESRVSEHPSNWIQSIVQKHRKVFHPIRHILVIMLLCGSLKTFLSAEFNFLPFGDGPWPCLNPAHQSYKKKVIVDMRITTCKDTKRPVGTFFCECGFIYSRRGPDLNPTDQFKRGRVVNFGGTWKKELKKLINSGLSLRGISKALGVDPQTIKRQATLMDLPFFWQGQQLEETKKTERFNSKKEKVNLEVETNTKRKSWLELMKENPDKGVTTLRILNSSLYYWLYRNDRGWLTVNSPKKRITSNKKRVDWNERDLKLRNEVDLILCNWTQSENTRPKKITKTAIAKKTQKPYLILKSPEKVPRTILLINSFIETDDQYNIRKLNWALKEFLSKGEQISEWALYKKAAIRKEKITPEVSFHAKNLLM